MLENNELLQDNAVDLPFTIDKGLIYYKNAGQPRRLCIPDHDSLIKEVIQQAHDETGHPGYARSHKRIIQTMFIQRLSQRLHEYLRYCPLCRLNQTPRHKPYGVLQPILAPPEPFYTITIDFILALPKSKPDQYDCLLTVTEKFTKRLALVPGNETHRAKDWALALLNHLMLTDWGLPKVIVSDRDSKFLSEIWKTWFRQLNVQLLTSTSYHPQTNGQSERTNQTVEIALHYYLATLEDIQQWPRVFPLLQSRLNNSTTITGRSPNKILHGFKIREPLDLILPRDSDRNDLDQPDDEQLRRQPPYSHVRIDAADVIVLAAIEAKRYYDGKHTTAFLNVGDKAYLRLHRGYSVPGIRSKKIKQQMIGPFTVLRRVGKLAYEMDFPEHWHVHPVVSIAQLEPAPKGNDPYQ